MHPSNSSTNTATWCHAGIPNLLHANSTRWQRTQRLCSEETEPTLLGKLNQLNNVDDGWKHKPIGSQVHVQLFSSFFGNVGVVRRRVNVPSFYAIVLTSGCQCVLVIIMASPSTTLLLLFALVCGWPD
jgi:hypothetical protein